MNVPIQTLLSLDYVALEDIDSILATALEFEKQKSEQSRLLEGLILAPLFFQESSRTYINSTTSFMKLAGRILPINTNQTRLNKTWSEPIRDFCQLINTCADFVVVRTPDAETVLEFAKWCDKPLINAGNGAGIGAEHPMQTLVDLFVIRGRFGTQPLKVLMIGGKHVRTTRSPAKLFHRLGFEIALVSFSGDVPNSDMDEFYENSVVEFEDVRDMDLSKYDVIYHSGADEDRSLGVSDRICLNRAVLEAGAFDGVVMHGLPRLSELSHDLDPTKYNVYYEQMRRATFVYQSVFALMRDGFFQDKVIKRI